MLMAWETDNNIPSLQNWLWPGPFLIILTTRLGILKIERKLASDLEVPFYSFTAGPSQYPQAGSGVNAL